MIKHWFAVVLLLLGPAACNDITLPDDKDLGFVVLSGRQVAGEYQVTPEAVFFRSQGVVFPDAQNPLDGCRVLEFDPDPDPVGGGSTANISAGPSLTMLLSGLTSTLTPSGPTESAIYTLRPAPDVEYAPGDSARFLIPGAADGFPEAAAAMRTAEPFTFNTVRVPAQGEGLTLTWTTAAVPASAMAFSLRYAMSASTEPEVQLYCDLRDDGSFTIPSVQLNDFRDATPESRSVAATRYRTRRVLVADAELGMLSTFTVEQATAP